MLKCRTRLRAGVFVFVYNVDSSSDIWYKTDAGSRAMKHKGDIEQRGPFEVFEYVASRRADGVIYFRDADGQSFVRLRRGNTG
ncbi:MAG: hypothetical protein JSW52_06255 [Candidatus Coatesbacteria bacterium]|nr:MAG: hypothetical protein JSW52_06255 [Candidatus Coatesbacteria bacterium]